MMMQSLNPRSPQPRHPEYSVYESRLYSFGGWPEQVVGQNPRSLAVCGFFYIGSADRVQCFHCGITLRNWEPEDDPAAAHLHFSPECPAARLRPGRDSQTVFRRFTQAQLEPVEERGERNVYDRSHQRLVNLNPHQDAVPEPDLGFTGSGADISLEEARRHTPHRYPVGFPAVLNLMEEAPVAVMAGVDNPVQAPAQLGEGEPSISVSVLGPHVHIRNGESLPAFDALEVRPLRRPNPQRRHRMLQCAMCDEEAVIVLLPCGHLILCANCVIQAHLCPKCHTVINGTVRAYLA